MSFSAYCLCHHADVRIRLRALEVQIQRRRITAERRARVWRLWWDVEQRGGWVS